MIWSQPQFDQRASVGSGFRLPVIIRLITLHGLLGGVIPYAAGFPAKIVLANQGLLDFQGTLRVNLLLSTPVGSGFPRLLTLAGG